METKNENLDALSSLKIISEMIEHAKGNVQRDSFYFLLWGWVAVIANLAIYYMLKFTTVTTPYWIWLITIPAWIITAVYGYRQRKAAATRSHFDHVRMSMWIAFGITVVIFIFFGPKVNYALNSIILLVMAIPTFISGVLIKFKPLMIGAIVFWICGSVCFIVGREDQSLLTALAIILGYLVPGYLLKKNSSHV